VKEEQDGEKAKFPTRQQGPHVHGVTTDSRGRVYICDLGSDATWVAEPDGDGLKVVGMMERKRGDTPRHALVSDDSTIYLHSKTIDIWHHRQDHRVYLLPFPRDHQLFAQG
jgi:6-phosphogluconolactonase (cycloisomerase 2 family)